MALGSYGAHLNDRIDQDVVAAIAGSHQESNSEPSKKRTKTGTVLQGGEYVITTDGHNPPSNSTPKLSRSAKSIEP